MSSEAFERVIHRIHELIEQTGTEVKWDDRIPDPDNPRQLRQIDISLRRNGLLKLIECRLQRARQDVKWIEELIGRRASLQAYGVIAVSDSGFTKGAISKAKRFGIVLRDLHDLTESEVSAWGRSHEILLYYYKYEGVGFIFSLAESGLAKAEGDKLAQAFRESADASAIFNAVADQTDGLQFLPNENFEVPHPFDYIFNRPNFEIGGVKISTVRVRGTVCLIKREVECFAVQAYGSPGTISADRQILVELFNMGETGLVHHGGSVSFVIDVSSVLLPPLSQMRFFRLKGEVETDMESLEVIGADRFRVTSGPISLELLYGAP